MITEMELNKAIEEGSLSGGGKIKWKIFEMSTNNDGVIMNNNETFMFTEGIPVSAYPICDGTAYRYNEGSCKLQIQAYKPYETNKTRYYFYAQNYNGDSAQFIDTQKLGSSAIKFVLFYVALEDFWNGVEE